MRIPGLGRQLSALLSLVFAVPAVFAIGIWFAVAVALLSVISFVCARWESIVQVGLPEAVSPQQLNWRTSIKAALDGPGHVPPGHVCA